MTLGSAAAAHLTFVVWCKEYPRQVKVDPAAMAARYGADVTVRVWSKRLVCSQFGSRKVDSVIEAMRAAEAVAVHGGFPVERAALGSCDLSVLHGGAEDSISLHREISGPVGDQGRPN
jgi:hypothetical protein